jgi:hypothetical protein
MQIGCAVAAAMLLAACARVIRLPALSAAAPPSRKAALQRLDAEAPCCRDWADLPFNDQLPSTPREYTVDHYSPVADLDGLRTHFLTFVLPKYKEPYRVLFKADPSARHLDNSYLLAPTATLLDANYDPISSTDVKLCEYIGWWPGLSGAFGAVQVDDPDAQYLVVTTSKAQLEATTYWSQSPASFSGNSLPGPASSGSFDLRHGPDGLITVGIVTSRYADAVDNGLCGKPKQDDGLLPQLKQTLFDR